MASIRDAAAGRPLFGMAVSRLTYRFEGQPTHCPQDLVAQDRGEHGFTRRVPVVSQTVAFVALAALYGLCDQSRWQPWCQPSAISEDHVKIYPVTARIGAEEDSALGVGEIAMNGQGVEVVGQVIA